MYTLCKVTSSTFKFVCALTAELQEDSLSKSHKPKCNLAWLLNTFLLYVVAVRELFLFFCLHCACFVYNINSNEYLWRFNICIKLVWYTCNGHIQRHILQYHYPQTNCIASEFCFSVFVLLFVFVWHCYWTEK